MGHPDRVELDCFCHGSGMHQVRAMAFWLKKFVAYFCMPLPVVLGCLSLGLWFMARRPDSRWGRRLVAAALLTLLTLSQPILSRWLLKPLESGYPPIPEIAANQALPAPLAACRYIVVLGGGNADTPGMAAIDRLSTSALGRITEAVRLARLLPAAQLILSGPSEDGGKPHAEVLRAAAISLGIDPARIRLIVTAHDTDDEAVTVKSIVGDAPIALVTSAWHMPRAAGLFLKQQVRIIPCPTDYLAKAPAHFDWHDLAWDAESFQRSTFAIHEYLGLLWTRLRNQR